MLGFFFRHYDRFVDRYVVYDDGSTDTSVEILRANPKVEVRPAALPRDGGSFVLSAMQVFESAWKESRGGADWVICTDIDEHLYHPQILAYLEACKNKGVTIIPALGYQMLSETFPHNDQLLCESVTLGAPWVQMNKLGVFAPDAIENVNFSLGRHTARPTGRVLAPDRDELLLLHYKYLGFERTFRRHEECAPRLHETDTQNGWCHRWSWSREQLRNDWANFERDLVDVSRPDLKPWQSHPAPRWWEPYRMSSLAQA
ncbi:MAG TPA: glycosyltransferase family 2 protein [Pseudolabrys sp.]|nr:glycosyltransferase family 2 protein [Pseudolabrys sp.]